MFVLRQHLALGTGLRTLTIVRSDLGTWQDRPYPSIQCSGSGFARVDMQGKGEDSFGDGKALQGCYHKDSGVAYDEHSNEVYLAVRWNMSTDLGDKDSPTHLVTFNPSSGQIMSRSRQPLAYIPWALAVDPPRKRLLAVWVNDERKLHEVVVLDPVTGNHTALIELPRDPFCTTQHAGDCRLAAPPWGKGMFDVQRRRWTLPLSTALNWNLTLVHVDVDRRSLREVAVPQVGYTGKYTFVTNTALDTQGGKLFIVALCAKRGLYSTSVLVRIDPDSGHIIEIPGATGIGWMTGGGNSVYDPHNSILYYIQWNTASFSERYIVALSTKGNGIIARQKAGSQMPPDLLLIAPNSNVTEEARAFLV